MGTAVSAARTVEVLLGELSRCVDRAVDAAAALAPTDELAAEARRALRPIVDRCCREFVRRVSNGGDAPVALGHLVEGLFTHSDVTLEEALQLLRVSTSTVWDELARATAGRLDSDELSRLETEAQRFHNDLSAALSTRYLQTARERRRHRTHTRAALLRCLLTHPLRMGAARSIATALNISLDGPWQVAVFEPVDPDAAGLERLLSDVRMQFAQRSLSDVIDGRVVVACAPVTAELAWTTAPSAAACGVGGVRGQAHAVVDSYDEAMDAVAIARRTGAPMLRADDVMLHRFLLGSLSAEELADVMLAPLAGCTPHRREVMLDTLEAYLDCAGSVTAVAERLHLHRQSVNYRIANLRRTFGAALLDADGRLGLHVAVRVIRLREPRR